MPVPPTESRDKKPNTEAKSSNGNREGQHDDGYLVGFILGHPGQLETREGERGRAQGREAQRNRAAHRTQHDPRHGLDTVRRPGILDLIGVFEVIGMVGHRQATR